MTKQEAMTTILDELHNYDFDPDEFDGKALDTALEVFGHDSISIEGDYGYALDLAAALDYFFGDADDVNDFAVALKKAVNTLDNDDYTFDADISTTYDLGEVFFYRQVKARWCEVDWESYVDFERLGEDIAHDTRGKFTRYGFFAPEAIF